MEALATHCMGLRHLNMNGSHITDAGLKAAAPHLSALQHLNVSCCQLLTELCLEPLVSCPGLQLMNASYINEDDYLTDAGLEAALKQHCPGLQHLSICGWEEITNAGLETLVQQYPRLQYLHALGTKISQEGVAAVALRYPRLKINNSMDFDSESA